MRAVLEGIQSSAWSTALRESTWGFPLLSALHVVALAWFGAALLLRGSARARSIGIAALLATGLVLFLLQPLRYMQSTVFGLKMALIAGAMLAGKSKWAAALWIAVIAAARGIAFF